MDIKIIQRRYPENKWDYKAVYVNVNGQDIIYYTLKNKGKSSRGVETYSGSNYISGSNSRSHSRNYKKISSIPKNIKRTVMELIKEHKKVKWSDAKYVDNN